MKEYSNDMSSGYELTSLLASATPRSRTGVLPTVLLYVLLLQLCA
jgi:hypothetical protein